MRFYMTEIWTSDWRQSVGWYVSVVGLRVVMEDPLNQFALLETDDGNSRLAIKGGSTERTTGRGAVCLVFEVADLDAVITDWTGQGIAIEGPEESIEGYRSIKIHDPDGTPIRVFEWVRSPTDSDRESIRNA